MGTREVSLRVVTPLEITILLEAHTLTRGFDHDYHPDNFVWFDAVRRLSLEGLIERKFRQPAPRPGDPLGLLPHTTFHTTAKGDFYVRHGLCAVPFPVERKEFVIPAPASLEDYGRAVKVNINFDDQGGAGGTD